jgi:hypothetical protein
MGRLYLPTLVVNGGKFTFSTVQPFALRSRDGSRVVGLSKVDAGIRDFRISRLYAPVQDHSFFRSIWVKIRAEWYFHFFHLHRCTIPRAENRQA